MGDDQKDDILTRLRKGIQVSNDEFPMESTPKERRKYAILQAAVTLVAGHYPYVSLADLIQFTKAVLAEIERQEEQ